MLAVYLPALAILCVGGLGAALPEHVLWVNALKSGLLSLARWLVLGWLPVGFWLWRQEARRMGALCVAGSLALAGLPPLDSAEGPGLRVLSANVQAYSGEAATLEQAIAAQQVDLVFTFERRAEQVPGMQRVADNHDRPMPRPSHGSAVFCRPELGCVAEITEEFGVEGCSMPVSVARVSGICLLGVHVPPPVPLCAGGAAPYVAELTRHIAGGRMSEGWRVCAAGDPVVVVGDLNGVPGGDSHRAFLQRGLRDMLLWRGLWAMSWPAGGGWPNLPFFRIDHLFAGDLAVEGVRQLRLPGTDHKATRFRVLAPPTKPADGGL